MKVTVVRGHDVQEPCSREGSTLAHWVVLLDGMGWKWRISESHFGTYDIQLRDHLCRHGRIDSLIKQ